jgi:hypothetical protein
MLTEKGVSMDPTYLKEYVSPFGFRLYDVFGDHLLLRCPGGMFLGEDIGGDIDLVFLGIEYVELPALLRGVHITKPRDEIAISIETKYIPNRTSDPGDRVYAVTSEGNRFHVIATNFWIHILRTHSKESSLPPLFGGNLTERDKYFRERVKEWYKLE